MTTDPVMFRDHMLSLYQSAVDAAVRSRMPTEAARPGLENGLVRAAAEVAMFHSKGAALPAEPPGSVSGAAWTTAQLAYALLQARIRGDKAKAEELESELQDGPFDLNWAETITEYVDYFGPGGQRRKPEYIPPSPDMRPIPFAPGAVVGLIADWGTGSAAAATLLEAMARHRPDIIIHLGDIYYSGTPGECERNFAAILNRTFDRTRVPVYNLTGNHDMYCGGVGYYRLLKTLNPPPLPQQPASFFCLRATDASWQFVAMDTGRSDDDPFDVNAVLVRLDPDEEDWLVARIAEFPGRTILLSHHQLFSAFAQIGPAADGSLCAFNPYLDASFRRFAKAARRGIAAWFWGHEHRLTLYEPYRGLAKGRCIGHGAVPVLVEPGSDRPLARIVDAPPFLPVALSDDDHVYMHGFAILRFGQDGSAVAEYYQENDRDKPTYAETL